jgi:ABC-type transport system involved in cytochrome c biogenesis permease component
MAAPAFVFVAAAFAGLWVVVGARRAHRQEESDGS